MVPLHHSIIDGERAHDDQALAEEFGSECLWWRVETVIFFSVVATSK